MNSHSLRDRAEENAEWAQVAFGLPDRDEDARELLLNAAMFRAAADDLDRLYAVVEAAPHDTAWCNKMLVTSERRDKMRCTCWKAGVL